MVAVIMISLLQIANSEGPMEKILLNNGQVARFGMD